MGGPEPAVPRLDAAPRVLRRGAGGRRGAAGAVVADDAGVFGRTAPAAAGLADPRAAPAPPAQRAAAEALAAVPVRRGAVVAQRGGAGGSPRRAALRGA